ncbi:addiction module protein [Pedobacter cryoconitis]|uniref:Addiction module component n=1 Tax=Pedobacter cryoconitis TaxID=188932 RepID=A0A7X0J6J7_9SPHI|nr:addiction module protein [Pedobacter cryoconitis]MBB6502034.1 hypothetical protein [Pedobacter cryoconitis]
MIAVELSFRQLIDAVRQLSPSEKLELNEVIWAEDITIPIEHQNIVNERISEYKANPETLLDWTQVSKKLKS